jgi:hypothetical protein
MYKLLHSQLSFTIEHEEDGNLNFIDLSLNRSNNCLTASIFLKPTTTDIMIHKGSCHPIEHKLAGINYLVNRIDTCPLTTSNIEMETGTCQQILNSNGYHHINIENRIRRQKN